MLYSVWIPGERRYDYYSLGGVPIEDDTPAPSMRGGSKIGYAPGEASWRLPPEAQKVGEGTRARGVVVHPGSGGGSALGDFLGGAVVVTWAFYGALAWIAYKAMSDDGKG